MAKKKIEIFIEIQNEKEFENIIKGNPGQLICAEVYSSFAGSCSALHRLFTTIKLDWSSGKMIMLKVPADEIEVLQRFRNQSEPVFLFILNEKVTKMFRGVDAVKIAEVAKKELYYFRMEEGGSATDRPTYNLDEPTPDEMGWLSVRAAEKKLESSNLAYRRATCQAARKRHRAELMVPHLQQLNFVLFWPHTTHAHPELYGRWDMNNIVMVGREVLQLTKEKADDILYAGDAPVNEASMHMLLSAPALAICFRILDTDKHFVSLVRSILYEPPPIDEEKPLNEQLPRKPAFDLYKTFSPTRELVWQMRREARIKRRQEEIERRARRLSEMQRLARQAQEEAIQARTKEKEQKKLELLKAGNLSALNKMADVPDEEINIVIPEELPEEMVEESSEEEDENEYIPPAGLLIPGFYAPPNDIAKANGLAILFPNQVLDYVVPQQEFLPPHVLVMLSILQRHAAIDVMRKHKNSIIHMGIFRAPTPFDAVHIAYTVHQFDSLQEPLIDDQVKLAFMVSVKVDVPLLELMDLGPQHVSRDRTTGEDECAAMFPVDYADSYPQFEDFGDMTVLSPNEGTF